MADPQDETDTDASAGRHLIIMLIAGMVMIVIGISLVFILVH